MEGTPEVQSHQDQRVRQRVQKDRILRARFAYRNKNCAKRREDPTAKARLCVGGHRDPDLQTGQLTTEAPTATKTSITCRVFLTIQMDWTLAAGDIEAAFLNGVEARRDLYFEPPAPDLEGVEPGGLIEIVKEVFGAFYITTPMVGQLAQTLLEVTVKSHYGKFHLVQHHLDSCLFLLVDEDGNRSHTDPEGS